MHAAGPAGVALGIVGLAHLLAVALLPRRSASTRDGLHWRGVALGVTAVAFRIALVVWLALLAAMPEPIAVRILLGSLALVAAATTPTQLIDLWLGAEVLCRGDPPQATVGYAATVDTVCVANTQPPFVAVHVPCCAEPPMLVIETLNALARQDYPGFEVHVIDNNTADEALWRPLEAHCRKLGPRFHFHHVPVMTGAKAGALNFALTRTDPGADLIAVVDSDYQAEPDFLRRLAPMFADPRVGGVQTRHDYRDWTGSGYHRGCYWEYRVSYAGYFITRDRYGAGLLTGTMCMISRTALERAGGWAHWCCTEDSELSIRILAAGYTIRYLPITLGRGTMPDTFDGYRRQRRRWRIGPTHELRHHARALMADQALSDQAQPSDRAPLPGLPRMLGRDRTRARLALGRKLLTIHHGLRELILSLASTTYFLLTAALAIVLVAKGSPDPPGSRAGALGLLVGTAATAGITWKIIRRAGGRGSAAPLGLLATFALMPVGRAAGLAGLFSRASSFVRTDKFGTLPTWADGIRGTVVSAVLGLITGAACVALALRGPTGMLIPITGYLAVRAAGWWAPLGWALYGRWGRRGLSSRLELAPTGAPISLTVPAAAGSDG